MSIGQKIALLRKEKGWTQAELANACNLSRGYIAAIEEGREPHPKLKTLALIANSLGVSIADLVENYRRK